MQQGQSKKLHRHFGRRDLWQRIAAPAGVLKLTLLDEGFPHGARKLIGRNDAHDGRFLAGTHRPAPDSRLVIEPGKLPTLFEGVVGRLKNFFGKWSLGWSRSLVTRQGRRQSSCWRQIGMLFGHD